MKDYNDLCTFRKLMLEVSNLENKKEIMTVNNLVGSVIPGYFDYVYMNLGANLRNYLENDVGNGMLLIKRYGVLEEELKVYRYPVVNMDIIGKMDLDERQRDMLYKVLPMYINIRKESLEVIGQIIKEIRIRKLDTELKDYYLIKLNYAMYLLNNILYSSFKNPLIWMTTKDLKVLSGNKYSEEKTDLYYYNLEKLGPSIKLVNKNI